MTVLMPFAFSFSSRFEPRNLSGPPWRTHSPSRGIKPGSIKSAVLLRLYHSITPAARAASYRRLTLGIVAMHLGRTPQFPFCMSRMSRAVVEGSRVTDLSSGRGGGFTVSQSLTISVAADRSEEHTSELQSRQYLV